MSAPYMFAPRPQNFPPDWQARMREKGNKDSGLQHNLDAQQTALEQSTATAFRIWMYTMFIAFSLFVLLRYI